MYERLTRGGIEGSYIRDVLSENDCETSLKMPVNVTVEEPRARVVCRAADRDVIPRSTGTDGIALRRVDVIVVVASGTADDIEGVLRGHELD